MPELPEVQTIIDHLLNSKLLGNKIKDIVIYKDKLLKNAKPDEFKRFLINETFKNITRIGKYIVFHLTKCKVMVVHLRMEGKMFYYKNNNSLNDKHLRIKFILSNDYVLDYCDSRMFGTFHIHGEDDYLNQRYLSKLALDPLDANFDNNYLLNKFNKINKPIKSTLLDQQIISGIGNIYADEILFMAKINPLTKTNKLNHNEIKQIVKWSKYILKLAIKYKGTTISSYKWNIHDHGQFQQFLKVHVNNNALCPICHNKIKKIKVNGRGTYFCPICQKLN